MSAKRGGMGWLYAVIADEALHRDIQAFRQENGILKESEALRILVRKGITAMQNDARLITEARLQHKASEKLPKGAWTH